MRRMTTAVGLPTLRLIRAAIGPHTLDRLAPGNLAGMTRPRAHLPAHRSSNHINFIGRLLPASTSFLLPDSPSSHES